MAKIEEMKSGRELDALVAERVFGWKRHETQSGYVWTHPSMHAEANAARGECPAFSTDIAAAWEVVSKLWNDARSFDFHLDRCGEQEWSAGFTNGKEDYRAEGNTAPHAICLAASKAAR